MFYETEEHWLAALLAQPSQIAHFVSERTGDTMLHVLVRFRPRSPKITERLQLAVSHLKELRYKRNFNHETPFCLLKQSDPFQLQPIIRPEPLVGINKELNVIENFLNDVKANSAIDKHFLLLEGPPGTGKTAAVMQHVKNLRYPIHVWVRSAEEDGYVARISDFFQSIKKIDSRYTVQVIFINQIQDVMPVVEGHDHNNNPEISAFKIEIKKLTNHRVVLIGATSAPERIDESIRALATHNYFFLPNENQRHHLLNGLFIMNRIEQSVINSLAKIAIGYSPEQLKSFVTTIKEYSISFEMIKNYFNVYAKTISTDFKTGSKGWIEILMPSFENDGDLNSVFSSNKQVEEQLHRIQHDVSTDVIKHTLTPFSTFHGLTNSSN